MEFGKSIATACSSFAITNIDDIFVLVTFFAEASNSRSLTPWKITLGQYIGFTVITVISMVGFGASLALPSEPIGFLGLLPILLGVWKAFDLLPPNVVGDAEEQTNMAAAKSVFKVASVTVMNGGDNIGTYIPLFAQTKGAEIAVYVVIYYLLIGVWCLAASLVLRQKHILHLAEKCVHWVIPLLYVGLGIYIIIKSDCYPWSIQRVDADTSPSRGKMAMAVSTTGFLLVCIGLMTCIKLRSRWRPNLPDDIVLMSQNECPGRSPALTASPQAVGNQASRMDTDNNPVHTAGYVSNPVAPTNGSSGGCGHQD